jgi:hypothetical protein
MVFSKPDHLINPDSLFHIISTYTKLQLDLVYVKIETVRPPEEKSNDYLYHFKECLYKPKTKANNHKGKG